MLIREGKSLSGNEKNVVFLNVADEGKRFVEVSAASGFDSPGDGRGMALVDWDQDGDLDVWLSNRTGPTVAFYENQIGQESQFVAFDLEGTAPNCNRDAVGARVEVAVDGRVLIRGLRAGEGFRSQSSKRVHFGLGDHESLEEVAVWWPGGTREVFTGAEVGKVYHLKQGTGLASAREQSPIALPDRDLAEPEEPKPFARLVDRPPFPKIPGAPDPKGQPRLVLLWQPECDDCRAELTALAQRADEIKSWGLQVLTLTADGDDRRQLAEAVLEETGYPFQSGYLTEDTVERILVLHRHLFYQPYHLVVPTCFLLDGEGRLAGVFRGGLSWKELAEQNRALQSGKKLAPLLAGSHAGTTDTSRPAVLIKAYLSAGMVDEAERVFQLDRSHPTIKSQTSEILRTLGEAHLLEKNFTEAEKFFEEALAEGGEDARVLNQLGATHYAAGKTPTALACWRRACQVDLSAPEPLINLGKNLLRAGETEEAMIFLERYHALRPADPQGHRYLATGHLRKAEFSPAREHLESLIALQPNDGLAYLNLAKIHLRFRDQRSAKRVLDTGMAQEKVPLEIYGKLKDLKKRLGN